ncbi:hypothetical protein J4T77_03300 [Wolbachia endosymbiont of Drosophila innubila]|nr:hypothetical protein J4T77_03300 [Wolbachia endosymbiont of Drosophila innubila]
MYLFGDKEGGIYELNVDLDKLSKGEMLNAIVGIGRTSQQLTSTSDKSGILSGLSCNSFCKQN